MLNELSGLPRGSGIVSVRASCEEEQETQWLPSERWSHFWDTANKVWCRLGNSPALPSSLSSFSLSKSVSLLFSFFLLTETQKPIF